MKNLQNNNEGEKLRKENQNTHIKKERKQEIIRNARGKEEQDLGRRESEKSSWEGMKISGISFVE